MKIRLAHAAVFFSIMLALLSACTAVSDSGSISKLNSLQQKYFVSQSYSTSISTMNDYLTELAQLRQKSGAGAQKIIDAETYSANAFLHLNRALLSSSGISYQNPDCGSDGTKETIASINMASASAEKAISLIQGLSEDEKSSLRPNQLQTVQGYKETIDQIKKFFEEKC